MNANYLIKTILNSLLTEYHNNLIEKMKGSDFIMIIIKHLVVKKNL